MDSIGLNMKSVEVNTESRTLRATWTREMVADLNMYHGLNIEDELSKMLNSELRREKRKKSINKIFNL
jgi:hypothetical protein